MVSIFALLEKEAVHIHVKTQSKTVHNVIKKMTSTEFDLIWSSNNGGAFSAL